MFVGSQTQFAAGLADMKRAQPSSGGKPSMLGPSAGYKQQYSPYGSPGSMPNHGSPGYPLPPRGSQAGGPNQTGSQGSFTSSTPPRPPSGPGTSTLQINQAQQLHINNPGHQIQVSGSFLFFYLAMFWNLYFVARVNILAIDLSRCDVVIFTLSITLIARQMLSINCYCRVYYIKRRNS